jgi:hypothetical protein
MVDYYSGQGTSAIRFRLNNLVVANIGAAGSLNVDVAITAVPAGYVGAIGFAVPVDADFTAALCAPMARITSTTNLRLRFPNASAGGIDPADTFDWDVIVFLETGNAQQTI